MAVRAKAWSLCVEDTERFTFGQAFKAYVTGDAVGNVLPLGPLASEGTKALLIRRNIATSAAFSSVVLENIFYSISVAIMVMVGTLAFLLGYRPTNAALTITLSLGAVAIVSVVAVWWLLRSQPRLLSRFLKHDAVRDAEDRVFRFAATRKERIGQILLLQFAFHVAAVLEIYFLLRLLVGHTERTLLMAVILGTVERLIMIAFKFVPLRLGRRSRRIGIDRGGARDRRARRRDDRHGEDGAEFVLGGSGAGDAGEEHARKKGLPKSAGPDELGLRPDLDSTDSSTTIQIAYFASAAAFFARSGVIVQ